MIRYKEKEFQQYFICPATGDIFDTETGEVQPVKFCRGRSYFKGMSVHRIMAHTFFGYKPGYDVHHLDENKLNNSLSNLVYLTRAEHSRLHQKCRTSWMKGKHHTNETKVKISATLKGRLFSEKTKAKLSAAHKGNSWNKGKHLSEEHKAKLSAAMKGKKRGPFSAETKAKMSAAHKGKKFSEETKAKMSAVHKGKKFSEED